jgi:hypothetical protein
MADDEALRTQVWVLKGMTGSAPALLELVEGRLALTTEDAREFEVALEEVTEVKFPWHYFGGGAHLTVRGQVYRLSFVKPNNASEQLSDKLSGGEGLFSAGHKVREIGEGRAAGQAWKAALSRSKKE